MSSEFQTTAKSTRGMGQTVDWSRTGFTFPTGPAKPEEFGSGVPVRFGRLPVGTGQIQI